MQAPVLSIFISSIRSAGLMLMPPESKQTPLPTSARWRAQGVLLALLAGAQDDHPRRVVAAAADGQEHAHAELRGADLVEDVDREAVRRGERARLVGEDLRG